MSELIERLKTATGPCCVLDTAIALVSGQYVADRHRLGHFFRVGSPNHSGPAVPSYTASVDAALTLVPEGRDWAVGTTVKGDAFCNLDFDRAVHGATPALAICIAALQALEQDSNGKTGGETASQVTDS